jgi:hypothetical protein
MIFVLTAGLSNIWTAQTAISQPISSLIFAVPAVTHYQYRPLQSQRKTLIDRFHFTLKRGCHSGNFHQVDKNSR